MDTANPEIARASAPALGDTIGPYRILRQLGQGTTGRVFEVEHTRIGRRAAMKVAHRQGVAPGVIDRLFVEARAVNLIDHPHVVEITDILVPDAQQPDHALVMELLDGRSLADVLAAEGPLPPQRFLPILAQVCAGLAAVHRAGFVHRDLKPENVFLVERAGNPDFVKLLDFGLVKAMRGDVAFAKATVEGMFMGSPAYASAEQAAGKPVDFRSDIYAVGVMVYELVTGELPFQAQHIADLLMKQVNAAPPRLSAELLATELGLALDAIIQACLVKDPAQRALSATQLAEMFRRLAAGDHAIPRAVRGVRALITGRRRRRAFVLAPVLTFAALALLAVRPRHAAPPGLPVLAVPPLSASAAATAAATPEPKAARAIAEAPVRPATPPPRRQARTAPRLSKAITLDPYR